MPLEQLEESLHAAINRSPLDHAVTRVPGALLARPLDLADPMSAYELRVSEQALAVEVELRPIPMGQAFVRAFNREVAGQEAALRDQVRSFGGIVKEWSVSDSDLDIRLSVPPPVRDLGISDSDLWTEVILILLRLAAAPFDEGHIGTASVRRAMLEEEPSVASAGPDMLALAEGSNSHRACENELIDHLLAHGVQPKDGTGSIKFDLAWIGLDHILRVCEVKSIGALQTEQIRLGIGQVTDYAARIRMETGTAARRILCLSNEPVEAAVVQAIGDEAGVHVTWPTRFAVDEGQLLGAG